MLRGEGEDVSVALVMKPGQAARLKASGLTRFHALDDVGVPMCMSPMRHPIYLVDYDHMLGVEWVPDDHRCHRWGCIDGWVGRQRADGH